MNKNEIIIIITVLFILISLWLLVYIKKAKGKSKYPYSKKDYLLSKAETSFFRVLEQAIGNKYYIFPQVHLSDLVYVKSSRGEYYKYFNKIDRKSVDFVLAEKNNLTPVLAIELDDNSHNYKNRIDRDNFVEDVFKNAGVPLLRIKCVASYDIQKIRTRIEEIIKSPNNK